MKRLFLLALLWAFAPALSWAQSGYSGYPALPSSFSGTSCANCSMSSPAFTGTPTFDGAAFSPPLSGTTASIGGGLLTVACTSGTVTVTGATTGMVVTATPLTFPGNNIQWQAYVSSANTVTVSVCTSLTLTPTASVYYVRVQP